MSDLAGAVAWVTGARGAIGRAVAEALAAEGARLFLSSRSGEALSALAGHIETRFGAGRATALPVDVTNRAEVDRTAENIINQASRIDILVNSTTCPIFGEFLQLGDSDWADVLEAKFFGYMRTMRAVVPYMIRQGRGHIINISGRGGHQPSAPSHLPGSAANAAVNVLTKGVANLYGPHGIRVNAIAPGPIASERYERIAAANARIAEKSGGPVRTGFVGGAPLGEMGQPADIADAVVFLASEKSRYVTGIVLQVDGGGTAAL